ncbi:DgyrCDS10618 [Dimorphilus gyrociliatus]|uniref:DgyrCDS10618 n=1 Tax=Dimorphilus gyrociliatus TaxID=2664684 RepID=A0A7I8W0U5_9ANNE|nr:DgyrCDS10618 [Dimorphilus gyrociliatus]
MRYLNETESIEEKIYEKLFKDYPKTRPKKDSFKPVIVEVGLSILQIFDLNEQTQTFTTTCKIVVSWLDDYLGWNITQTGPVYTLQIKGRNIWLPDIVITNSAAKMDQRSAWESSDVQITYQGSIFWLIGGKLQTFCQLDMTYFPFDHQLCLITLGTWSHSTRTLILKNLSSTVDLSFMEENGGWVILWTRVEPTIFPASRFELTSTVSYLFCLKRRTSYHMINIIVPCVVISILAALGFLIPSEAGEKISYGITVLLSFTVFQLKLADSIPESSLSTPILY